MPRKSVPASYRVTASDLAQVLQEHAVEWEMTAYLVLTLGRPNTAAPYVEVTLREGVYTPAGREVERVRYPLSASDASLWPQQMLHAAMAAYEAVRSDPWRWPARKRKEAAQGE